MKVDYHIHTLCSDGVYTIEKVIQKIMENNISSFSITDHDTISGIRRAKELSDGNITFVNGLEITCSEIFLPELQKSFSIHLLGYLFDETNQALIDLLEKRKLKSSAVFETLSKDFADIGYPFSITDVPISCGTVLQLCDITDYLKKTYPDISENYLARILSYAPKLSQANISISEGIAAIHAAGGKAVWAHPFIVYHNFQKQRLTFENIALALTSFQQLGLDGLEADYLDFQPTERKQLRNLASKHSLFYTAGSDFHGSKYRDRIGIESSTDFIQTISRR